VIIGLRTERTLLVHELAVGPKAYVLGSGDMADVRLADPAVSRLHCALIRQPDGGILVVDRDSRNGTFIDGVRCVRAYLHDRARLTVGQTTLVAFTTATRNALSPAESRAALRAAVAGALVNGSPREAARALGLATAVVRQLMKGGSR